MVVDGRKTLVWGTACAAIVSATLLASSGGGPRVAGLVGDAVRSRPLAAVRPPLPESPATSSAAADGPAH